MRRGTTLIELMIALVILAIVAALVSGVGPLVRLPSPDPITAAASNARHSAISLRRSVSLVAPRGDTVIALTAWPDGIVIADTTARIDPFTGVRQDVHR
jgi:prepilin-type N-terminal cleavage/methylation domain-containing protein